VLSSKSFAILAFASAGLACSGSPTPDTADSGANSGGTAGTIDGAKGGSGVGGSAGPGTVVDASESSATASERRALQMQLAPLAGMSRTDLAARYPTSFTAAPTYDVSDPAKIGGLPLIQASSLALSSDELATLGAQGFVISSRMTPTFTYGYATIYMQDLPLYVSADSLLFAVHRSYDEMLASIETKILSPDLDTLLGGMRARLAAGDVGFAAGDVRRDADVSLAVAASLLAGRNVAPVAGGEAQLISDLVAKANAHDGQQAVQLFGVTRNEDFSQFEPRGHYTRSPELERYFRAMMWLGRIDFRMLETQPDGRQLFRRRQLLAALALRDLVTADGLTSFARIDDTVTAFVGEHDYMQLHQLDALLADLHVTDPQGLSALSDEAIAQAIRDGNYGAQRISSHIMINGMSAGTLPLSASFAFLGQRYVLDSHVLSNVVYDRAGGGSIPRMLPSPLDAAFAALGNNQAASLLESELDKYGYAPDLAAMRVLADAHPAEFWQGNLYNHWLGALRTLAPKAAPEGSDPGLPAVAKSERWGKRLLSTQLASWAELRHDTILYAKQSYTGGNSCDFPDAYVDPYPEFYAKLGEYAAFGETLVDRLAEAPGAGEVTQRIREHFSLLADVASRLQEMAEHELTGAPFTSEMMDFINDAVTTEALCGSVYLQNPGWYGKLFLGDALEFDPTIADVHTQPTDEAGNPVGKVLHVGTGPARMMVVITEGCSGPRAYMGLASSYYEKVTDNFRRLNDERWATMVYNEPAPAWLSDLVK